MDSLKNAGLTDKNLVIYDCLITKKCILTSLKPLIKKLYSEIDKDRFEKLRRNIHLNSSSPLLDNSADDQKASNPTPLPSDKKEVRSPTSLDPEYEEKLKQRIKELLQELLQTINVTRCPGLN